MMFSQQEGEDMSEEINEMFESTAHARCDACQAQAYSQAVNLDCASDLLLCLHHRKKHGQALLDEGWMIIDDCQAMEQFVDVECLPV